MAKRKRRGLPVVTDEFGNQMTISSSGLIVPMSPHQKRMADINFPFSEESDESIQEMLKGLPPAERARVRRKQRYSYHLVNELSGNGSGFPMSELLRWYFREYAHRIWQWGADYFPCSFNVMEAFMYYNEEYAYFVLHRENDHFLSINDYFEWYSRDDLALKPGLLMDVLAEKTVYSYDMLIDPLALKVNGDRKFAIAGVSMIRHGEELSVVLLAGENPPAFSPEEISEMRFKSVDPDPSVGGPIEPDSDYGLTDRDLKGYDGFSKVVVLARIDLRSGSHDVRYVNIDIGRSFIVLTDDETMLRDLSWMSDDSKKADNLKRLEGYDNLFSGLVSLIYLPVFFVDRSSDVVEVEVLTSVESESKDKHFREIIKALGRDKCTFRRIVKFLRKRSISDSPQPIEVEPPDLKFESTGFWRPIGPQEIGEDKDGNAVVGRTWISRTDSWSASSPQMFLMARSAAKPLGLDPGEVYVQRSPSHGSDIYKIGLTRRNADLRAGEVSSATGVPLAMSVVASWAVGNCGLVEKMAHEKLAKYRLNPNREFFMVDLRFIIKTITSLIDETETP